ncbi:Protein disulfide isomerase pTAC5 chloroplastic, partial [Bienertia sinuspersici]
KTAALLQAKYLNQISEFSDNKPISALGTSSSDFSSGVSSVDSAESEKKVEEKEKKQKLENASSSLKVGAEGEEVRALQEALMSLGFYSGEEDMEYSSFSTGTERAVKTWQASIGIHEDGVMTVELLERLYASQQTKSSSPPTPSVNDGAMKKDEANGAPINVKDDQQTVVKKEPTDTGISENRVFLLGENRWEDSSRITKGNDKLGTGVKAQSSAPKCLVCRGEGRLLCMECDGTGDLNIEEQQFLDWAEEGAKCPYCEGLGYTICDVCDGKCVA